MSSSAILAESSEPTDFEYQQAHDLLLEESPALAFGIFHHRTTRNAQLELWNRQWLFAIYREKSQNVVIAKSSQVGITDYLLCDALANCYRGRDVMYVLPRDKDVWSFSPRRFDKLIQRSEFYRKHRGLTAKDSDSKTQKTIFGHELMLVGSNAATNFFEKPIDHLVIDEHDKCDQANLPLANDRLQSSLHPMTRKVGNPILPETGIDELYHASDKKQWFVKCPHCNERQVLDWFVNFVVQEGTQWKALAHSDSDATAVCRRCSKPIDRLSDGEWVAEHPDRLVSGYHCSKLFADPRPLPVVNDMIAEFNDAQGDPSKLQVFYNSRLGLPYTAAGARISLEVLESCSDKDYVMPHTAEGTVCGVDVGKLLHVHIEKIEQDSNGAWKRRKVYVGTVREFEDLHMLTVQYRVNRGVIDSLPETRKAREFCQSHSGWYLAHYPAKKDETNQARPDRRERIISLNRTESLDASMQQYLQCSVVLPKTWRSLDNGDFAKQMIAPVRVWHEDRKCYVWDEGGKADHHRHADNYALAAAMLSGYGRNVIAGVWI